MFRIASPCTPATPRKRKSSYPRSVYSRLTDSDPQWEFLKYREQRYARLLSQKIKEAHSWIYEQARRSESEYIGFGGLDGHSTDNTYEDYQMMYRFDGVLGENHPEYDEEANDSNFIVSLREPILKTNQYVLGRARKPSYEIQFGVYWPYWIDEDYLEKTESCCMFWDLFSKLGRDWLKMLSIGQLWLDMCFVQRRIVRV